MNHPADPGTAVSRKIGGISKEKWIVTAFFLAFLLTGLGIYKDYGISWDEPEQQRYGHTVVDYMFTSDRKLITDWDKYHGPAFEILLDGVDRIIGPKDTQQRFRLRHLLNFLLFYFSVWCFYLFCRARFNDWHIALLGCLMLVTCPRIFGQAFYNSKDLPFLSLMIISFLTLQRFGDQKTVKWAILHGLSSGLTVAIRILGLLVPAFTMSWLIGDLLFQDRRRWRQLILTGGIYGAFFFVGMLLFWPILWDGPLYHLWQALKEMSRFPWSGTVVYLGDVVSAANLPWHYIPVWVLLTVPPVYLLLSSLGILSVGRDLLRDLPAFLRTRILDLSVMGWVLVPCAMVIVLHSVVYDGWRHLYFIYPGLVFFALLGWTELSKILKSKLSRRTRTWTGRLIASAVALQALAVVSFMVRAHPYEGLYFNSLIGGLPGARFRMEMDYFGLSYRSALEALANHDKSPRITVFVEQAPAVFDAAFLEPKDYSRLVFVRDAASAMYFLGAYRSRTTDYPYGKAIHTEKVDGVPILSVYKLRDVPPAAPLLSMYKLPEAAAPSPEAREELLARVRRANRASSSGESSDELRERVEEGIRRALRGYISATAQPEISLSLEDGASDLREGRIGKVGLSVSEGAVGDFRRKPLGIPFRNLRVALYDVTLDVPALLDNRFDIQYVARAELRNLELFADAINAAVSRQSDPMGRVRLAFASDRLTLQWLGSPRVRIDTEVSTVTDDEKPKSENLWLQLRDIRIGFLNIPGSWAQWILRSHLPLIKASPKIGVLQLGRVEMKGGRCRIGTDQ